MLICETPKQFIDFCNEDPAAVWQMFHDMGIEISRNRARIRYLEQKIQEIEEAKR